MRQILFGHVLQADNLVREESMSSLQLFAGQVTYATEARKEGTEVATTTVQLPSYGRKEIYRDAGEWQVISAQCFRIHL